VSTDDQRHQFDLYKRDVARRGKSFYPYAMFHDTVMSVVVVGVIIGLACLWYFTSSSTPNDSGVLGPRYTDEADPGTVSFVPRPDWYFYFLFYLLRIFKWPESVILGTVGIPTIALILLMLVPFYDRRRERRIVRRPVAVVAALLVIASRARPDLDRDDRQDGAVLHPAHAVSPVRHAGLADAAVPEPDDAGVDAARRVPRELEGLQELSGSGRKYAQTGRLQAAASRRPRSCPYFNPIRALPRLSGRGRVLPFAARPRPSFRPRPLAPVRCASSSGSRARRARPTRRACSKASSTPAARSA
jgi:hypothetical protein